MAHDDERILFELDRLLSYDNDSLINEMHRVAALMPNGRMTRSQFDSCSRVATSTLIRRFGGWRAALDRAGIGNRYSGPRVTDRMRDQPGRQVAADDVIAELRRIADLIGTQVISGPDLRAHSNLADRVIRNRFGSWKAAVEAAGLEVSPMGRRWTDSDYYENLLDVWTFRGRAPTYAEMNLPPSRITNGAYASQVRQLGKGKARIRRASEQRHRTRRAQPIGSTSV